MKAQSTLGLEVNNSKCEILLFGNNKQSKEALLSNFSRTCPGIRQLDPSEAKLLGSPLTIEATDAIFQNKLEELSSLKENLKKIDSHDGFFLLKHCLAIPRLNYLLRCTPSSFCSVLDDYDSVIRDSLEVILNVRLNDRSWDQASLPVSLGGLGIRRALDVSLAAFLVSSSGTAPLSAAILSRCLPTLVPDPDRELAVL